MKNISLRITYTAMFIALIVVVQWASRAIGAPQLLTGALVNFILITAGLTTGLAVGIVAGLLSPLGAFLVGIGPTIIWLIPFVALGNVSIVIITKLIVRDGGTNAAAYLRWVLAIAVGAVVKFGIIYLGNVQIVLPLLTELKPPQVEKMSVAFSLTQLFTALLGGAIAMAVVPLLKRALRQSTAR